MPPKKSEPSDVFKSLVLSDQQCKTQGCSGFNYIQQRDKQRMLTPEQDNHMDCIFKNNVNQTKVKHPEQNHSGRDVKTSYCLFTITHKHTAVKKVTYIDSIKMGQSYFTC